jgi:hypothetical protein
MVGGVELALNEWKFAGQDVAVDVVEQIESDEQRQRRNGGADARANGLERGNQVKSISHKSEDVTMNNTVN